MTGRDFELLREIYQEIKDLRAELLAGHDKNEQRIVELEKFQSSLTGKIGVGVLIVGTVVTTTINFLISWLKERL